MAQLTGRTSDQLPGGGLISGEPPPVPSVETSAFPRWEYKVVHFLYMDSQNTINKLNEFGAAGWECAASINGSSTLIFKRQVPGTFPSTVNFTCANAGYLRSDDIAAAINDALNNGHPLRNAITSLNK